MSILFPAFGFIWRYRNALLIGMCAVTIFGLWQLSTIRAASIKELKGRITLLKTVVNEYENAQRELDGKVRYEKDNSGIAAESAAAVAAGRISGDGHMAPVLRAEYERVLGLAKASGADTR